MRETEKKIEEKSIERLERPGEGGIERATTDTEGRDAKTDRISFPDRIQRYQYDQTWSVECEPALD